MNEGDEEAPQRGESGSVFAWLALAFAVATAALGALAFSYVFGGAGFGTDASEVVVEDFDAADVATGADTFQPQEPQVAEVESQKPQVAEVESLEAVDSAVSSSDFEIFGNSQMVLFVDGEFVALGIGRSGLAVGRSQDGLGWVTDPVEGIPQNAELGSIVRTSNGWATAMLLPGYISEGGSDAISLGLSEDLQTWTTTPLPLDDFDASPGSVFLQGMAAVGDQIAVLIGVDDQFGDSRAVVLAGHRDGAFEALEPPIRDGWFSGIASTSDRFLLLAHSDTDGVHILESPDGFTWSRSGDLAGVWTAEAIATSGDRVVVNGTHGSSGGFTSWVSQDSGQTFEAYVIDSALSEASGFTVSGPAGFATIVSGTRGDLEFDDIGNPIWEFEVWFSRDGRHWSPLTNGSQTIAGAGSRTDLAAVGGDEVVLFSAILDDTGWSSEWESISFE